MQSGVTHCTTCEGIGRVASHARPTVWNPYPETTCDDCGGREGPAPCEVCGFAEYVAGYDCFACDTAAELPRHVDVAHFAESISAAMAARNERIAA